MTALEHRLAEILRTDPILWPALCTAEDVALPDWWIVSGAIYNTVWNTLTGRPPGYGIRDIDLFYFDASDLSYEAEDRIIRRARPAFAPDPPVEIRNQARVHLWFEAHFGHAIAPLTSCRESIGQFASETHAVGVRLTRGEIEIHAPFGLDPVFGMRMVPNQKSQSQKTHEEKAKRAKTLWPEVEIVPWPDRQKTGGAHAG
ncbi:MAG: nucleotidyltransferase family protein [Pseudomonadota bacterium]